MPKWSFSREQKPDDKPAVPAPAPVPKTPAPRVTPPSAPPPSTPGRRSADSETSSRSMQSQLEEAETTQARLRLDLAELLKAHRQQGRVLERNQKLLEQTEHDVNRARGRDRRAAHARRAACPPGAGAGAGRGQARDPGDRLRVARSRAAGPH